MSDFFVDQRLWNDADHFAAGGQGGVGQGAHQADARAAVNHAQAAAGAGRAKRGGQSGVLRAGSEAGAAIDADATHGVKINSATIPLDDKQRRQ